MDELTDKLAKLQFSNENTFWFKLPEEVRVLIAVYTFSDTKMHWTGGFVEREPPEPTAAMLVCKNFMPRADIWRFCLANRPHILQLMPGLRWDTVKLPKTDQSGDIYLYQQVFDQAEMAQCAVVKRGYRHIIVDVSQHDEAPESWRCPPNFDQMYTRFPALQEIDIMVQVIDSHFIDEPYDFPLLKYKLADLQARTMRQTRYGSRANTIVTAACVRYRFAHYQYLQPTVEDGVSYFIAEHDMTDLVTHFAFGLNESTELSASVHGFARAARERGIEVSFSIRFHTCCERLCCSSLMTTKWIIDNALVLMYNETYLVIRQTISDNKFIPKNQTKGLPGESSQHHSKGTSMDLT